MDDPHDLQRFVDAQAPVIQQVLAELRRGRKTSHWMWFIFPQIAGLGQSAMARTYAIHSLDEARAYLAHPVLGPRLRDCTRLVNAAQDASIAQIFGSPDDMKLHASMTLFALADDEAGEFRETLRRRFGGTPHAATLDLAKP